MRTTIWAVIAVVLVIANFVLYLGTAGEGGAPSVKVSAAVGYALGSAVVSALLMIPKKYRGWGNFFRYAAIMGLLALFSILGHIKVPPKP